MISRAPIRRVMVIAWWVSMFNPGTSIAESSHEEITTDEGRLFVTRGQERVEIENPASYCLDCHGGSEATDDSSNRGPWAKHELGTSDRNHPVDLVYPDGRSGYWPADALDERVVLIKGRMTCLTCHSRDADRALVIPKEQSRLCVACHDR